MCLTKPRLSYNGKSIAKRMIIGVVPWQEENKVETLIICVIEDILADEKGECVICLEDLQPGDVIARLPCLCIYHKKYAHINPHETFVELNINQKID